MIEAKMRTTGFEELDKKLQYMHTAGANRIVTAALRAGLRVAADAIRKQIPKSVSAGIISADKGVGVTTKRKAVNGASGKTGVGVGGTQKKAIVPKNRGKRKGVGVSARNLHWFALGTADRFTGSVRNRSKGAKKGSRKSTGNPVHFTGKLDKAKWGGFVQRGIDASKAAVFSKMAQSITRNLAAAAERGESGAIEGLRSGN